VVVDTSGSMDAQLLGKALGAVASYCAARDVVRARVVFCDAAGWLGPDDIAGRLKVRGRGGTVLQPGVDLLERSDDFPYAGPILVITDADCDRLAIRREHAFLIPLGKRPPSARRAPPSACADPGLGGPEGAGRLGWQRPGDCGSFGVGRR